MSAEVEIGTLLFLANGDTVGVNYFKIKIVLRAL